MAGSRYSHGATDKSGFFAWRHCESKGDSVPLGRGKQQLWDYRIMRFQGSDPCLSDRSH
jgi:hypothetical protein